MVVSQKRKRHWDSKGLFGFRPTKFQVLEDIPHAAADNGAASRPRSLKSLIEGSHSNNEDTNVLTGTATKKRHTSSKIFSLVRFAVVSGMYNTKESQGGWPKLMFTRYERIFKSFQRKGRCPGNCQ